MSARNADELRAQIRATAGLLSNPLERAVALALLDAGWAVVDKLGGTAISAGFPDFWTVHPDTYIGGRWLEVKRTGDRLTAAQWHRFTRWRAFGGKVWVVTERDDPARVLRGPANVGAWLARGPKPRRAPRYWVDGRRRAKLQ